MFISLLSTKKIASDSWMSLDNKGLIDCQWFSFWLCLFLTALLTIFLVLFGLEIIEIIIATFSMGISSTSQLLRLSSARTAMCHLLHPEEREVLDTLDAIGMAGVGTLVVLYLLA
ncbi:MULTISPECIES: hypothetical protein [unclassified Halomonas]|uniref:hypothetical protein n=1 Tax=unclassified Halomonas TaxID=2609666 RepID=UPI001CF1EC6B|nr:MULTISPECIES: hypothetical protein [unclassified Halomonas]MCA8866336.1 hypothetical protein [Halomonas sp. SBBP1]UZH09904.1 hypothetical protein OM794_21695 [Halomonas sp. BDJS001]